MLPLKPIQTPSTSPAPEPKPANPPVPSSAEVAPTTTTTKVPAKRSRFQRLMGVGKWIFIRPAPKVALDQDRWWNRFPNFWAMVLVLLLLTIAGGYLRYWHIGQQSYWHDESRTIGRLCKPLNTMLDDLARSQGFAPGWYFSLHWWQQWCATFTGSVAKSFSPEYIRGLPVILGTLMIPAMYFLARQFTDRRGALLVAMLTAVNPYLIYYSRDIKMYMGCWLFLTLHLGCLFAWMSAQSRWKGGFYWAGMMLAGAVAVALHSIVLLIIPLELIWLLTRPRLKALDAPLWLTAIGLTMILPIWWYTTKNKWLIASAGGSYTGLEWNFNATTMEWPTIWGLGTVHLLGFLWPKTLPDSQLNSWYILGQVFDKHLETRTLPWLMDYERWVAIITGSIMAFGLLPWRGIRSTPERQKSATAGRWWWIVLWIVLPVAGFASTWIPHNNDWYKFFWSWYAKAFHNPNGILALWEPRYLGIILPALILWLAASLRRLPFWPVRTMAILFVLAVSLISALSNHLIYRQEPWGPTSTVLRQYWNANDGSIALITPETHFPDEMDRMAYELPLDITPQAYQSELDVQTYREGRSQASAQKREKLFQIKNWKRNARDDEYVGFLYRIKRDAKIQTIIITDRNGDLTDGPLTDAAVQKILGKDWKLDHSETYRWYYEWRYYFFHVWRTRVWVRQPVPVPMSQPTTASTQTRPLPPPATLPTARPAATAPGTRP